ncbi:hypothetical protein HPP92_008178 [Vanilla planifolia]|uniref:Alliinase C-terminal domain-containing protein n=1 Tax=Vanilla planifolia TaxID=51239 RepID=A0A835V649_VANPL|nr:hypothetical protein HPP92_008178 [Vanilla planifolia]
MQFMESRQCLQKPSNPFAEPKRCLNCSCRHIRTAHFVVSILLSIHNGGSRLGSLRNKAGSSKVQVKPKNLVKVEMPSATQEINVNETTGSLAMSVDSVINLDRGDPKVYEKFWLENGAAAAVEIPGWQKISYFSDLTNLCWFLEPDFAAEIRRLHRLVGNAVADHGRHIVVGTGSSQLFLASLFALSTAPEVAVACNGRPVPYYPAATNLLKSGLFRWEGDACSFHAGSTPYIEVVCSPRNPDGSARTAMVKSSNGKLIHDLAYYWPQYTAITGAMDEDIMLFTVSKCTGHAGTRLGWALVKDAEVARRMTKFIEVNTIGVSKDSQYRAVRILKAVCDGYELEGAGESAKLFHFGRKVMARRWEKLREVLAANKVFGLMEFKKLHCEFMGKETLPLPAFAWLECGRDIEDCESFLRQKHKVLTRGGKDFGADGKHARVSMLGRDEDFDMFIQRLKAIRL